MTEELTARLMPLSDKPINFHYSMSEMFIMAEPSLVERAIQNLITNAQRYTQDQY